MIALLHIIFIIFIIFIPGCICHCNPQEPGVLQWTRDNIAPSFPMFIDLGARQGLVQNTFKYVILILCHVFKSHDLWAQS